jgi:hypothetical protein
MQAGAGESGIVSGIIGKAPKSEDNRRADYMFLLRSNQATSAAGSPRNADARLRRTRPRLKQPTRYS